MLTFQIEPTDIPRFDSSKQFWEEKWVRRVVKQSEPLTINHHIDR
jgi:hypothetical protein